MRGRWGPLVAAVVVAGTAIAVSLVTASSAGPSVTKIHVIEHATTDTVVDTGASGDTTGDLLTFHNEVFDETDAEVVGDDQGDCIRIDPAGGTWECRWITNLSNGSITVEGPFFDTANSVLAITGGTGAYRGARGTMRLVAREGGTEFDFVFRVVS